MTSEIRQYRISHRTRYVYSYESSLCHNRVHLRPRQLPYQTTLHASVEISPKPDFREQEVDSFGNPTEFFSIEHVHGEMKVHSECLVERRSFEVPEKAGITSRMLQEMVRSPVSRESVLASEFVVGSSYCLIDELFARFVEPVWNWDEDALLCTMAINDRIHQEFRYHPASTNVTTDALTSLRERCGVCQDFAHVFISCMRTLGIPARYVSGYLNTLPPPGKEKLVGADASHAWVSVYLGAIGWVDLDPTNRMFPNLDHVTLAWGRDYADVPPVQGVFVGGGQTKLDVAVDVTPAQNDSTVRP